MNDIAQPRLRTVDCLHPGGLHRMAYWEWGDPSSRDVVVCVHGLSRQGRDFDALARNLAPRFRVVCPDVVGRGRSDRLDNPAGYQIPQYVSDMVALLARLDAARLGWVGTSMGGLIGIGVAGLRGSPVNALVLNDIGPSIAPEGLRRIAGYVGREEHFGSVREGVEYLASISAEFGPHTPEQWHELNAPMLRPDGAGWRLHYDPAIRVPLAGITPELARAGEQLTWQRYDQIRAPTLLLRGADSDILAPSTAREMGQRGPRAELVEFPGVGHAPMLMQPEQIAVITDFLRRALPSG